MQMQLCIVEVRIYYNPKDTSNSSLLTTEADVVIKTNIVYMQRLLSYIYIYIFISDFLKL